MYLKLRKFCIVRFTAPLSQVHSKLSQMAFEYIWGNTKAKIEFWQYNTVKLIKLRNCLRKATI